MKSSFISRPTTWSVPKRAKATLSLITALRIPLVKAAGLKGPPCRKSNWKTFQKAVSV